MQRYRRHVFPSLARRAEPSSGLSDTGSAPLGGRPGRACEAGEPAARVAAEALDAARRAGFAEGREAGYAEGEQAGAAAARRAARDALDALAQPLASLVAGFTEAQHASRAAVREQIAQLVEQAARQVIRGELEARPERLLACVDEALTLLPQVPEAVAVRLNPDEYRRIVAVLPEHAARWTLTPDPSLDGGECRVSAGGQELDAGCAQRLAACIERIGAHLAAPEMAMATKVEMPVADAFTTAPPSVAATSATPSSTPVPEPTPEPTAAPTPESNLARSPEPTSKPPAQPGAQGAHATVHAADRAAPGPHPAIAPDPDRP
ncbi:FliH/SctL family protein [Burkholderia sp. 3C]